MNHTDLPCASCTGRAPSPVHRWHAAALPADVAPSSAALASGVRWDIGGAIISRTSSLGWSLAQSGRDVRSVLCRHWSCNPANSPVRWDSSCCPMPSRRKPWQLVGDRCEFPERVPGRRGGEPGGFCPEPAPARECCRPPPGWWPGQRRPPPPATGAPAPCTCRDTGPARKEGLEGACGGKAGPRPQQVGFCGLGPEDRGSSSVGLSGQECCLGGLSGLA